MEKVNYKVQTLFTLEKDYMIWLVYLDSSDILESPLAVLREAIKCKIIEKWETGEFEIISFIGCDSLIEVKVKIKKQNSKYWFERCPQWSN